ncbi:unnamed protein product [Dovyalis caffra]|uniref:Glycosyl transferase CAP10 domain-containing protein n=1 Tax=Dovyalis caffra TaxID=77055 RepID=A0AAV1SD41_9ROSI|nr:unnamed protein product [Dovyalis caffra]
MEQTCATNYPVTFKPSNLSSTACPEYFRWIHEDLRLWKSTGISRAMVERAKDYAHFRLVIVDGKVYAEKYKKAFHTRDVFTIWGILQLLRLYPGKVPDLELMFSCDDRPVILKKTTKAQTPLQHHQYFNIVGMRMRWALAETKDWRAESEQGYKNSKLEDQCTHSRYKIYIEGRGWSVSEKYILACDSMTLFIKPEYYGFFIRSMVPLQHYWPISARNKCRDIKFAVQWGNNHTDKAQAIGRAGSKFIQENLRMEYVYDYMFHLLTEYAKLLKFKPRIPEAAVEVCSETMACPQRGLWKKFMEETTVKFPSDTLPCTMPPPYEPRALEAFLERKEDISRQVEMFESKTFPGKFESPKRS